MIYSEQEFTLFLTDGVQLQEQDFNNSVLFTNSSCIIIFILYLSFQTMLYLHAFNYIEFFFEHRTNTINIKLKQDQHNNTR
jgi:hypothetical protein